MPRQPALSSDPAVGAKLAQSLSCTGRVFIGTWHRQLVHQLTALRWRSTVGIIRGHRVRRRFGPNGETFYEVVPESSYQVENVGLLGDRLSFSDKSAAMTQSQALEIARARYPEGAVVAYYDPKHPERSVLERDINYAIPLIAVLVAGLFAQAGHVFACRS